MNPLINKMSKKIKILVFLLILIFNSSIVFAEQADDEYKKIKEELEENIATKPLTECRKALAPAFDIELYQFLQFLETNFQNKSSNSSLTNTAIARYRDYKRNLNRLFAQLSPKSDEETYETANANFLLCSKLKNTYFDMAKKSLIDHVKKTGAQKQAIVLLEKYQAINTRLRDLNLEISQMYGYFMTFFNKLPGFLQNCITS